MTRMEEWSALQQTLEQTPPELEDTVARAKNRAQKRIWAKRLFGIPMAGAAALLAGFVLLVNLSTPFAYACADIPGLKPLVQAVAMNPSLRETLTHNYVQDVLATQQAGEFTVTVDAMIVDEAEMDIFYHIDCAKNAYKTIYTDSDLAGEDQQRLQAFLTYDTVLTPGKTVFHTISFGQNTPLPDTVHFTLTIQQADLANGSGQKTFPEEDYTVTFNLPVKSAKVVQSRIYNVQKWVEIDDQRLFIDRVDVHPTHARIYIEDAPANTAWLEMLYCTLRDENGNEAGKIKNGLVASGSMKDKDHPFSVHLESPYFWNSKHLTLKITGAEWLDKEKQYTTFDLSTGFAQTPLPPSVYSARTYWGKGALYIGSVAKRNEKPVYSIAAAAFHDQPNDTTITDYTAGGFSDQAGDPLYVPEGYFGSQLTLPNYAYDDTVTVQWHHTHESNLAEPLQLYLS